MLMRLVCVACVLLDVPTTVAWRTVPMCTLKSRAMSDAQPLRLAAHAAPQMSSFDAKSMVVEIEPVLEEARVLQVSCALVAALLLGPVFGKLLAAALGAIVARCAIHAPSRRGSEAREIAHLLTESWKQVRTRVSAVRSAMPQAAEQREIPKQLRSVRDGAATLLQMVLAEGVQLEVD